MEVIGTSDATAVGKREWAAWSDPQRYLGFTPPINAISRWGQTANLYFIASGDLVKIGISQDVSKRLLQLRAGNPEGLRLLAARTIPQPLDRQIERRMHAHFAHLSVGREWFRGLDLKDALRVAAGHIRHADRAIARWTADGFCCAMDDPSPAARSTAQEVSIAERVRIAHAVVRASQIRRDDARRKNPPHTP